MSFFRGVFQSYADTFLWVFGRKVVIDVTKAPLFIGKLDTQYQDRFHDTLLGIMWDTGQRGVPQDIVGHRKAIFSNSKYMCPAPQ